RAPSDDPTAAAPTPPAAVSREDQPEPEDALARALADLRSEIEIRLRGARAREVPPVSANEWLALFEQVRRRLRTLGMSERSGDVDDFGLDPEALRRARPLLALLREQWWRVEVRGFAALPQPPVLFVANRSGLLPYDGLMISDVVARAHGEPARPRFLVADWIITMPFAQHVLARLGGVRACRENAERLLRTGRSVVAFPEGQKGAAKTFRHRYRLQRFGRGGAVRVALETRALLVPVAVVGAEETHPVLFKVGTLARAVGLPFLPVTPTFPWLGPLGALPLPSKWSIRFGEPLATQDLPADAARDELLVSRVTEELRQAIQAMLDADVHARGGVFA
ncbi:MAG TPA: lysophospholipid acyltransferase family protein, partial [Planctomycetota bacterium]|nr:lysophospholipid acyltransferase family protein [Planctomycetota bacterium]